MGPFFTQTLQLFQRIRYGIFCKLPLLFLKTTSQKQTRFRRSDQKKRIEFFFTFPQLRNSLNIRQKSEYELLRSLLLKMICLYQPVGKAYPGMEPKSLGVVVNKTCANVQPSSFVQFCPTGSQVPVKFIVKCLNFSCKLVSLMTKSCVSFSSTSLVLRFYILLGLFFSNENSISILANA